MLNTDGLTPDEMKDLTDIKEILRLCAWCVTACKDLHERVEELEAKAKEKSIRDTILNN